MKIKRALLSVSNKEEILKLGHFLQKREVEIISSGGTRKYLESEGIKVTPIEEVTGNPEAFGGRMKTLSFQISSALLYRRNNAEDIKQAADLDILPIDLVVCNLYPFAEVAAKNAPWDELIENIDIGGPTMVRAAAKNYKDVVCLTSPGQYENFMKAVEENQLNEELSLKYALAAFSHTASYDSMITRTLSLQKEGIDKVIHVDLDSPEVKETRYGENPHQRGYVSPSTHVSERTLANAPLLQGKALSYNNYLDADSSWRCNSDLFHLSDEYNHCVTIVKHSNPCGAAVGKNSFSALEKAWAGDPISSFGSIITFSQTVDKKCAQFLCEKFVEVIIAPHFSEEALNLFKSKKNLRLLELAPHSGVLKDLMIRSIHGGHIIQEEDEGVEDKIDLVTESKEIDPLSIVTQFGIKIGKHLKSNAIVLIDESDDLISIAGAGMGNPNRLVSVHQACEKAKENGYKSFSNLNLISDAFFPFRDNIDLAHELGIRKIIQPGGSIKDKEVIKACDEYGISMAFTGMRHFRH